MSSIIVFTGGGSGGHVFPGLAVMEEVKKRWRGDVVWIGSISGMERDILTRWDVPYYAVPTGKLRREFSLRNVADVFRVFAGIVRSFILLKHLKPKALFSKGGYVSVPPVIAARLCHIPVVTHESDADPGLATRINARFAERIFVAYEETREYFPAALRSRVEVSGNPIRSDILSGNRIVGRKLLGVPNEKQVLLVLGGSQGAAQINELVVKTLSWLTNNFFVVHQTGASWDSSEGAIPGAYYPVAFIGKEYGDILASADLVVCRAGAGTLWELAVSGKPSILIPLSGSGTRGDQVRNARLFEARGAAVALYGDPTSDELMTAVASATPAQMRENMACAAREIGTADAAPRIANTVYELASKAVASRGPAE